MDNRTEQTGLILALSDFEYVNEQWRTNSNQLVPEAEWELCQTQWSFGFPKEKTQ